MTELLDVDPTKRFDEAVELASDRYLYSARITAEEAGKAAATHYVSLLIAAHGFEAWKSWCQYQGEGKYYRMLTGKARRGEPIGLTIDWKGRKAW